MASYTIKKYSGNPVSVEAGLYTLNDGFFNFYEADTLGSPENIVFTIASTQVASIQRE